jgi:hypothetical protein
MKSLCARLVRSFLGKLPVRRLLTITLLVAMTGIIIQEKRVQRRERWLTERRAINSRLRLASECYQSGNYNEGLRQLESIPAENRNFVWGMLNRKLSGHFMKITLSEKLFNSINTTEIEILFSPDSRFLAVYGHKGLQIFDIVSGSLIACIEDLNVIDLIFAKDGSGFYLNCLKDIYYCGMDDLKNTKHLFHFNDSVAKMKIDAEDKNLILLFVDEKEDKYYKNKYFDSQGYYGKELKICNIKSKQIMSNIPLNEKKDEEVRIRAIICDSPGQFVILNTDGKLERFQIDSGRLMETKTIVELNKRNPNDFLSTLLISDDNKIWADIYEESLYQFKDQKLLAKNRNITDFKSLSKSGKYLMIRNNDGKYKIIRSDGSELEYKIPIELQENEIAAFDPSERFIATVSEANRKLEIKLWLIDFPSNIELSKSRIGLLIDYENLQLAVYNENRLELSKEVDFKYLKSPIRLISEESAFPFPVSKASLDTIKKESIHVLMLRKKDQLILGVKNIQTLSKSSLNQVELLILDDKSGEILARKIFDGYHTKSKFLGDSSRIIFFKDNLHIYQWDFSDDTIKPILEHKSIIGWLSGLALRNLNIYNQYLSRKYYTHPRFEIERNGKFIISNYEESNTIFSLNEKGEIKELNYKFPNDSDFVGFLSNHLMISNEMNLGIYYSDNSQTSNIFDLETGDVIYHSELSSRCEFSQCGRYLGCFSVDSYNGKFILEKLIPTMFSEEDRALRFQSQMAINYLMHEDPLASCTNDQVLSEANRAAIMRFIEKYQKIETEQVELLKQMGFIK